MDIEDWFLPGIILLIVALAACAIIDHNDWVEFKATHDCKVVAHVSSQWVTVVGTDGKVGIGSTGEKTGYLCNDGVTYYR